MIRIQTPGTSPTIHNNKRKRMIGMINVKQRNHTKEIVLSVRSYARRDLIPNVIERGIPMRQNMIIIRFTKPIPPPVILLSGDIVYSKMIAGASIEVEARIRTR